jgi:hypothetical protein
MSRTSPGKSGVCGECRLRREASSANSGSILVVEWKFQPVAAFGGKVIFHEGRASELAQQCGKTRRKNLPAGVSPQG